MISDNNGGLTTPQTIIMVPSKTTPLFYMPTASRENHGVVKIGNGLNVSNGVISTDILTISKNGDIVLPDSNHNVNLTVPTKTSDLTNDNGFVNASYVNNAVSPKLDKNLGVSHAGKLLKVDNSGNIVPSSDIIGGSINIVKKNGVALPIDPTDKSVDISVPDSYTKAQSDAKYALATDLSDLSDDVDEINSDIDKSVVASLGLNASTDNVSIVSNNVNIKTGATTSSSNIIPLANDTTAGLISHSDYLQIRQNTEDIAALKGQTVRIAYSVKPNPTAQEIEDFVVDAGYEEEEWSQIAVVVTGTNYVWRYYENDGWIQQTDVVSQFTNSAAGIILGSTADGKVYAETDGTGSVNGWDTLKNRVTTLENNKQDNLTAGAGIAINNNVISSTITNYLKSASVSNNVLTLTKQDDTTVEFTGGEEKPYLSVERLGAYTYKATFDSIPVYDGSSSPVVGGCSSFVKDGKLYRNLDWNYDNTAEFEVVTKNFKGMAFISGVNDGNLESANLGQLPYHLVDGVNSDGIMASTHILYNDWQYAGSGNKNVDLTTIVYHILNDLHDIDDISTVMTPLLSNIKIPTGLANLGYVAQFLVTDGTTTYALLPPTSASGSWDITNISALPKLTNFRWLNKATITRSDADLQLHPTGIERWNLIGTPSSTTTTLEDLRFTLCYESNARLSEFIGIDDTTKDSTDAELEAIYDLAHTEYLDRERDGVTWQSVHSVVYSGTEFESLHTQENYEVDYIVTAGGGLEVLTGTTSPNNVITGKTGQLYIQSQTGNIKRVWICPADGTVWKIIFGYNGNGSYCAGNNSNINGTLSYATAIGADTTVISNYGTSVGAGSEARGEWNSSFGAFAIVRNVTRAIQLGEGTNSTANTLQVFGDNIYNHSTHTFSVQNLTDGTTTKTMTQVLEGGGIPIRDLGEEE